AGRFSAALEDGDVIISSSGQPLVDGARELIARGYDASTLLTMRMAGKSYDSFRPAPIGEWAKWTYGEGDSRGLQRKRWTPFAANRVGQKSGFVDVSGPAPQIASDDV